MATIAELRAAKVAARKAWKEAIDARAQAAPGGWEFARRHMSVLEATKRLNEASAAYYAGIAEQSRPKIKHT